VVTSEVNPTSVSTNLPETPGITTGSSHDAVSMTNAVVPGTTNTPTAEAIKPRTGNDGNPMVVGIT